MTIMANIRVILPASTGSPCVKQSLQYTICSIFRKWLQLQSYCSFHMFLCPTTNLLAYHDEGDLHKRSESDKGAWRNNYESYLNVFSILVRCHDLYHKMGDMCGNGLLGDMLNERTKLHWQPLFTLCERFSKKTQLHYIRAMTIVGCQHCAPSFFRRMNSKAC